MKRLALPGLACALALAGGCGPMKSPMPRRFDPEGQKAIDESWDRAFTPPGRLDHPGLLDVMVGTQAYQLGVDTFHLRAEKRVAGGRVVMDVTCDRARPDADAFTVTLFDAAGKPVREERYSRAEVDAAYDVLYVNLPAKDPAAPEPPAVAARRAEHEARWDRIREVFPQPKEGANPPAGAPAPRPKG